MRKSQPEAQHSRSAFSFPDSAHNQHKGRLRPLAPSAFFNINDGLMKKTTKIRNLLILPLLAALSGCISSPAQFMMDREVTRLCELDGGVHVYEQVPLSKENFGPRGQVFPQYARLPLDQQIGPDYSIKSEQHVIRGNNPDLWRSRLWITRKGDNQLLGEKISYNRAGGGLWGHTEGNAYSCDDISDRYSGDLISKIFVIGNAK